MARGLGRTHTKKWEEDSSKSQPVQRFTSCVTLGESLNLSGFGFFIRKPNLPDTLGFWERVAQSCSPVARQREGPAELAEVEAEAKASRDESGACDPEDNFPPPLGKRAHTSEPRPLLETRCLRPGLHFSPALPPSVPRLQEARRGEPRGESCRAHTSTNRDKDKLLPPA